MTVTATDPSSLSDTIEVTITVTDVNEAPTVTVTPTVYFNENGTGEVATYTAADPENAALMWKVTGVDSDAFSIDTRSSHLQGRRPTLRHRRTPTLTMCIW